MIENYTLILYKGDRDLPCYECPLSKQCDDLAIKIKNNEFYKEEERKFFYNCMVRLLDYKPLIPVRRNEK